MMKLAVFLGMLVVAVVVWFVAGTGDGPSITVIWPTTAIGRDGEMVLELGSPSGKLSLLNAELIQDSNHVQVFTMRGSDDARVSAEGDVVTARGPIGRKYYPELHEGSAQLRITAGRPVLFGLQQVKNTVTVDIAVRLTPPTIGVLSTHHYINHGGSEVVVYRVSEGAAASGVRVGNLEYPGFPAAAAGGGSTDPQLRVAFFALLWDQDVAPDIKVYARDDAGNEAVANFDFRVFPKVFRKSRIELDDRFLARVVPAILQNSPELQVENPTDLLASYLRINRDLRAQNNSFISSLAGSTAPRILWGGAFRQLSNTAVEAGFADQRTYVYEGNDVDQQTHLGFDLASTSMAPVAAANHGTVLHAGWLGIYGNCVILDHGMGLQSLYAHLSSIQVKVGDNVRINDTLGRSGATGLAGGDHLHFTMLLHGRSVNPIDWWSAQWVEDRVLRKLREAGLPGM